MAPIARIARDVFSVPGMDKDLRMPKKSADNEAVITAAGAMAEAAQKEGAVFVEHGLPADFVGSSMRRRRRWIRRSTRGWRALGG